MIYKTTLIALTLGVAFYLGMACRPPPRIVTHEILVEVQKPVYLPAPRTAKAMRSIDMLAAAIPASALTAGRK